MMTQMEFQKIIAPVLTRWTRGYSSDQVSLLHSEFQTISSANFERLVTHLLGTMRVAPMIPDFKKAMMELGIRGERVESSTSKTYVGPKTLDLGENYLYCVRDNIWADNFYIFIRGKTVRECAVVIKADHPDHPYVKEDAVVRNQRIQELKQTQIKQMNKRHQASGFRKPDFSDFQPEGA